MTPVKDKRRRFEKEIALYNGALRLIEDGADLRDVTMQQIADAAGVGKGTIYEYFPSKEDLLRGLTGHCMNSELAALEKELAPCQTYAQMEQAAAHYLLELFSRRAATYRIVLNALLYSGGIRVADGCQSAEAQRLQAMLKALIARLRQGGEISAELGDDYCIQSIAAACISAAILMRPGTDTATDANNRRLLQNTCTMLHRSLQ